MSDTIDPMEFEQACVSAARTFGRADNIRVVFQGEAAMTDGSTIYVPSLDRTKPLDKETAMVARGFIDHEAGHIRHTNLVEYKDAIQRAERRGDKFFPMILNAIEDVRIEECVVEEYPGSAKNIDAMNEALMENVAEAIKTLDAKDWRVSAPISILAADMKRRSDAGLANIPSIDNVIKALPSELLDKAREWLDLIDKGCRRLVERQGLDRHGNMVTLRDGKPGTKDAIAIAEAICKETYETTKVPKPEPQPGAGTGGAPGGEAAPGEGGGAGEPTSARGNGGQKDKIYAGADGKESKGGGGGVGSGDPTYTKAGSYSEWAKGAKPIDVHLKAEDIFRGHMAGRGSGYVPFSTAHDRYHTRRDKPNTYTIERNGHVSDATLGFDLNDDNGLHRYHAILTGGGGRVGVMSRKLERALMDKLRRGWRRNLEEGSFDPRRVVRAATGHPNVFRMREDSPSLDTAVSMVIDLSGSMNRSTGHGRRIELAQEAAVYLAEALHRVGVPFDVLGFHSVSDFPTTKDAEARTEAQRRGAKFSRWTPIDIHEFKAFDDRLSDCRRAMGTIHNHAGGDNCDGESILYAYQRLKKRTEKKKVMLVLSDGQPATATSEPAQLHQHLRDTVAKIKREGTHIVGIGIATDAVRQYYDQYTVLHHVEDLGKTTLDHIARFALGERFKVDNRDLLPKSA